MICEVGDRIELLEMPNDPCPIPAGTTGTVRKVQVFHDQGFRPWYQISVDWDTNRSLALVVPPDEFRVIAK